MKNNEVNGTNPIRIYIRPKYESEEISTLDAKLAKCKKVKLVMISKLLTGRIRLI